MSYFNHAYRKSFLGTKATQAGDASHKAVNNGFLIEAGVHSRYLGSVGAPYTLGAGTFGFFNKDTFLSVIAASAEVTSGAPLVLAAASLLPNDKIGPFHGGYNESNKSKLINPKYIHKFVKMTGANPEQCIVHVGATNLDQIVPTITTPGVTVSNGTFVDLPTTGGSGAGLTVDVTVAGGIVTAVTVRDRGTSVYVTGDVITIPANVAAGFTVGTAPTITLTVAPLCSNFDFLCGETYNLRLDLFGSPVLRLLNHDAYRTLAAYTGCCSGATPTPVDSTLVMIDWAKQIMADVFLKDFIQPIVYTEAGVKLDTLAAMNAYVSSGHTAGKVAGLRLVGAYVDTKFGNCSFHKTDFYEKEVVRINASLTDLTGNPCVFKGICINVEHKGYQGQGFGETILRDIILDEAYLQNFVHDDPRMREINQGDQILGAVNRNALYTRYVIQHSVLRHNNPSSVYDNDQYALNIYVPTATATSFEAFMAAWLTGAGQGVTLETFGHTAFIPAAL